MLLQIFWLLSLLSIVSSSTYSFSNTSIISVTKPSIKVNSSTTSTTSSTPGPTSVPPTFYLVGNETDNQFIGSYLKLVPDPENLIPQSGDKALRFNYKNSTGAANFTLNDDGTLQCNSESGPLYASIPSGQVGDFPLEFQDPNELDNFGLVAVTCEVYFSILDCQVGEIRIFYYDTFYGVLLLGTLGESFTLLKVVST